MVVSIVTPTYNRAHLLGRLYKSLCEQTCSDFEWLVVDDGSTDKTQLFIKNIIGENKVNIRYLRKRNGGKHTAVNMAVQEAKGELIFIADSDDWLPPNAIQDVIDGYGPIKDDEAFAGICGLDAYADGTVVGSGLPIHFIDTSPQDIRLKWGVSGDLKEVFRTKVLKKFPFPEIPGEKFCPEILIWNRIGQHYKLRYLNKIIYTVEYQSDGLTNNIIRARMKSPVASMMTYSESFELAYSFKSRLRMAVNFWRFAFCAPVDRRLSIKGWGKLLFPVGLIFHIRDNIDIK